MLFSLLGIYWLKTLNNKLCNCSASSDMECVLGFSVVNICPPEVEPDWIACLLDTGFIGSAKQWSFESGVQRWVQHWLRLVIVRLGDDWLLFIQYLYMLLLWGHPAGVASQKPKLHRWSVVLTPVFCLAPEAVVLGSVLWNISDPHYKMFICVHVVVRQRLETGLWADLTSFKRQMAFLQTNMSII